VVHQMEHLPFSVGVNVMTLSVCMITGFRRGVDDVVALLSCYAAVGCKDHVASLVGELNMSMEQYWHDTDKRHPT